MREKQRRKKEIEEKRREGRRKEERDGRGRLAGGLEASRGRWRAWTAGSEWVPGKEVGKRDCSGDKDDDGVVVVIVVEDGDDRREVMMGGNDGGEW